MKRIFLALVLLLSLFANAGTITYFPKGSTSEQAQGLSEYYPDVPAQMVLIIGHGIGERNNGDLAGCKLSSGWGGWGNIKVNADKYGIILIFINTSHDYEYGEYQFGLQWGKKKYPALGKSIWIWGHSLGSYGAGKYAMKDSAFTSQIAGWIASASGDFTGFTNAIYWQNLFKSGIKAWGVTAVNDLVMGTSPRPIRELYAQLKAVDVNAHVIKTEFPATEWPTPVGTLGSKTAHNAVLSRLSQAPPYYSKGDLSLITFGIPSNSNLKMDVYQWMISNPRGSIYQDPTNVFSGARYDTVVIVPAPVPTPAPSTIPAYYRDFIYTGDGVYKISWSDSTYTSFRIPAGDGIAEMYSRPLEGKYYLVVQTKNGIRKIFGPKK